MFAHALQSMQGAVSITDLEDNVLFVNQAFCDLYGYSEDDLLGRPITMVRSPHNPPEITEAILPATLRGGWEGELWNRRRDGTDIRILLKTSPVRDEAGQTIALVGVATDITRHKRHEDLLRRSEEMYSKAFHSSPAIGAILSLRDYRYVEVNTAFEERTGFSRAQALWRTPIELGFQRDPACMERVMAGLRHEGRIRNLETRFYTKAGGVLTGLLSAEVVEFGGESYVVTAIEDITERKHAEEALGETHEQLAALSMAARDAIIMMDDEGRVSFWNTAAERMFGYSQSEVLGKDLHGLLAPPGYVEKARQALPSWRQSGQGNAIGKTLELLARCKDGVTVPVELSLSSSHWKGRWNAVGIIRDISERHRAEDEVREAHAKLSRLVVELEKRDFQNSVLSEMRQLLQACSTTEETGPVVAHSVSKLFPDLQGALLLLSPSKTDLEAVVRWGGFPDDAAENVFAPEACWGLRRGVPWFAEDPGDGLACPHLKQTPPPVYACLPLVANTEVLGLLHVRQKPAARKDDARRVLGDLEEISRMLCELLSLSIANVQLRETLSHQSIRDPLTGLFNRRYFEEALQRELARASRNGQPVTVVMADVDQFKQFNDRHGHAAGDTVLAGLAGLLNTNIRDTDVACRYGGEEFALVLAELNLENGVKRVEKLRQAVKTLTVTCGGRQLGPVTLSFGVAAYPEHGTKPEEVLGAADTALYTAKRLGRDRVVVAP